MSDFSIRTGKLDNDAPSRSGGKAVAEWSFVSPFRYMGGDERPPLPEKLIVKVMLQSTKEGLTFCALSNHLPEAMRDSDINRLHKKVEAVMQAQHDLLAGVTWEDWIEVRVVDHSRSNKNTRSSGLIVTYEAIKRGISPTNGEAYTINSNHIAVPFPKPKKAGELDAGSEETEFGVLGGRERDVECSYLPATPENLAALDEIMSRLQMLRSRLSEFLREDTIKTSLANINEGMLSLPFSSPGTEQQP